MPIVALEESIRTLEGWGNGVNPLNELSKPNFDIYINLLYPFERELDFNLMEKQNAPKWEKKLLIFYVNTFKGVTQSLLFNYSLLFESHFILDNDKWFDSENNIWADEKQSLLLSAFEVFECLFFILENKCNVRGLDILRLPESGICQDLYSAIIDKRKKEEEENARAPKLLEEYMISKFTYLRDEMGLPELPRDEILKEVFSSDAFKAVLGTAVDYSTEIFNKTESNLPSTNNTYSNWDSNKLIRKNPQFKKEAIPIILEILKIHFEKEQLDQLEELIKTEILPSEKLLFRGNGKTLLDFFKQLWVGQFLSIVQQKDLETWISDRFEYYSRNERKKITSKYANAIISCNDRAAKGNRLIDAELVNGKFGIMQLKIKNREQS